MQKNQQRFNPNYEEKRIPLEWVQGLSQEQKEDFIKVWLNSTFVFDPLKRIIQEYIDKVTLDDQQDYSHPNWAFERADKNGQITSLKKILRLLP